MLYVLLIKSLKVNWKWL